MLGCALTATGSAAAPAVARDAVVTSFDGTRLVTHFFGATAPGPGGRSPTVLVGPGYGKAGHTSPEQNLSDIIGALALRRAGYNVLTWDPRGLGASSGKVMFDSPDFEARDVTALLDHVAAQPEALLDAPGDPRVGMSGFSYGAGIQYVSAATDSRIDAIVPEGGWHSLVSSLFKDGAVKAGWFSAICGGGEATALGGGLFFGPAGLQTGGTANELKRACAEGLLGGRLSEGSRRWFAGRGPGALASRITAPTLIAQGTVDALFGPGEAIANYQLLRAAEVPVKMIWYCGGHGSCDTAAGEPRHVARAGLAWFARHLKKQTAVDTGPRFEWIADDGVWRSGPDFPLAPSGTVEAAGAGDLVITAADGATSGAVTYATPAVNAATIGFRAPPPGSDIIGEPRLSLTYRGSATPARTFLYAQILDNSAKRVVGVQVTPIPVILDGRTRTIARPLEPIAVRGGPASDLRLQITPGTNVYAPQRSTGSVRLRSIAASLPLVDATRAARASQPPPLRPIPRRLRMRVTSRRAGGASRIVLTSRLRSRPCSGSVTIDVRIGGTARRSLRTPVTRSCAIRAVVVLRVRPRTSVRFAARFEGNSALGPRRARSVVRRVR